MGIKLASLIEIRHPLDKLDDTLSNLLLAEDTQENRMAIDNAFLEVDMYARSQQGLSPEEIQKYRQILIKHKVIPPSPENNEPTRPSS